MVSGSLARTALLGAVLCFAPVPASLAHAQSADDARPVLAVREAVLKPGVDPREFEKHFADTMARWWHDRIPGVKLYLARGERGDRVKSYLVIYEFDSLARRNEYFPQPDVSSERFTRLFGTPPAWEFSKFIEPVTGYTDYVVLKP